jgi:D-glycero-alpha-D-manno-heptose 1-phosphate guanylyltransferase
MPKKFSFEHDWIKTHLDTFDVRVFPEVTRFIDIGIPSDYERAQALVPMMVQVGGRCA